MTVPYHAFGAVGIDDGSTTSLNSIPTASISNNDIAIVLNDEKIFFYRVDNSSGEDENVPFVVTPLDEGGAKRWILMSQEIYNTNLIQTINHYVQTSYIKSLQFNPLVIESADGHQIIFNENGSVEFPEAVRGVPPIENNDFTTKLYVDTEYDTKDSELKTYTDIQLDALVTSEVSSATDELTAYAINELESYVDQEIVTKENELKSYVDQEIMNALFYDRVDITSWTESDGLYYHDITINTESKFIQVWKNDMLIYPHLIENLTDTTVRIWMPVNENISIMII